MKKSLSLLLALLFIVASLSACAQTAAVPEATPTPEAAESPAAEATPEPVADPVTISVGRWGGNESETASFTKMLEEFTAKTGILVEDQVYTDFNVQLQADLVAGTAPDVFYVDAYMAKFFIEQGLLQELDRNATSIDQFYTSLSSAFESDGALYAVPKDYSTLALYYNRKWVQDGTVPTTMEELLGSDFLTNLAATLPEGVAAMTYNVDLARNLSMMQVGGLDITRDGNFSNLNQPGIIDNLRLLVDAAVAEKVFTPADLGMGWNGDAFGNEKTAMMIEGNWVLGHLRTNFPDVDFGVIEVPTFKGVKQTMVFTVGYGINSQSEEPEAALAFVQFATGPDGMFTWASGAGVLPSRMDVAATMAVEDDEKLAPHVAGAAYATPWQKGASLDIINREFGNYMASVFKGELPLEEGLKSADEAANAIIE